MKLTTVITALRDNIVIKLGVFVWDVQFGSERNPRGNPCDFRITWDSRSIGTFGKTRAYKKQQQFFYLCLYNYDGPIMILFANWIESFFASFTG